MLNKDGVATTEQIAAITPSATRLAKGAVAIVECFQNIPCNPCYTFCPRKAMKPLIDINDLPSVNTDICNGCGVCISHCPGLAIFVVDNTYSETEALIKIPYEFVPLPAKDSFVTACDRRGNAVCRAKVEKVICTAAQDRTAVVHLIVPKELSMTVRSFKIEDIYSDDTYVCRCEELTMGELREYIRQGFTTFDEIKRMSRAGMGACSGRTCRQIIMNEIAKMTGIPVADQSTGTFRPPVKPIRLGLFCEDEDEK